MKKGIYPSAIVAITSVLLTFATAPAWAQATTDDTDDSSNFSEFIGCLFDGTEETTDDDTEGDDTTQSVAEAIEGTAQSVPTEQDIRDCFEPIYEPAATTDGTVTVPTTGTTGEADTAEEDEEGEAGDEGGTEGEDEEG
jgi:hypothetical protein